MKRYILFSLFLHSLVLLISFHSVKQQEELEKQKAKAGQYSGSDMTIIDLTEGEGKPIDKRSFYWGIGITGEYKTLYGGYGYLISGVAEGYNGQASGLRVGDFITTVNDKSIGINDEITGPGPMKLFLTFMRNGQQLSVRTERCKVYY